MPEARGLRHCRTAAEATTKFRSCCRQKPFSAARWLLAVFLAAAGGACSQTGTSDQTPKLPVIRSASFTFPALASVMAPVIRDRHLDQKNGFNLQIVPFGSVATYYAALATGEVDTLPGGPMILQKMRNQGVPLTITNTFAALNSLVVIARDTGLSSLSSLKGKRLAADMGSSEFQILRLIAHRQHLDLGRDVEVIQATPPVARAHLLSGEVQAILTFEPTATMVLEENPGSRIIARGAEGWRALNQPAGWLLVSLFREEFLARHPKLEAAWIEALGQAANFIHTEPEAADRIISAATGLKAGILLRALSEHRILFKIVPAIQAEESLWAMFQAAVDSGFARRLPDAGAVYHSLRTSAQDGGNSNGN